MLWHGNDVPQRFVLFIGLSPPFSLPSSFSFEDEASAIMLGRPHVTAVLISSYRFLSSHVHALLPGLALGGVWGLREGARKPQAVSNARLRVNSILNSVTHRGSVRTLLLHCRPSLTD